MKYLFLYAITALLSLSACAQASKDTTKPKPQIFTVSGDMQTFQRLLEVLDNSSAPHTDVKALEQWVVSQIQKQIPQTTGAKK